MEKIELKIKEIEEELQKLKDYLNTNKEENKSYKRKRPDRYWFLNDIGTTINIKAFISNNDNFKYSIGNYFETKEQAENYKEKLLIEQELKDIARELNKDEEIDWEDDSQDKYYLSFGYYKKEIGCSFNNNYKVQGVIYCSDKNFKDIVIERIGEERLKKYLKGELD